MKESAYKAVYPYARPTWKDFTFHPLSPDGAEKPMLQYHTRHPIQGSWNFHASVSHDGDFVFTTVIVEAPVVP